ncbi:SET and MYND domain-containing protein 4 [Gryllus bimaculatus]|nr:SET and MYND domain-containing protein 4 [Gryllus bimaculatus]
MLAKGRFRGAKPVYVGVAIYPSAALCNHECYPGLARYFVGTTLVLRALRPLRAGDALAENYGPAFVKFPLASRKKALLSRYWFNCTCSTKGCSQLVRLSQDVLEQPQQQQQQQGSKKKKKQPQPPPQASVKCKGCQRRVGVAEAAREVQEAERTYADALDRMEAGDAQGAVPLFCAYVDRLHALGHPPRKNLHLAQEALRICMADAGNTWVAPDKD